MFKYIYISKILVDVFESNNNNDNNNNDNNNNDDNNNNIFSWA